MYVCTYVELHSNESANGAHRLRTSSAIVGRRPAHTSKDFSLFNHRKKRKPSQISFALTMVVISSLTRRWSSSSARAAAQSYLKDWVGTHGTAVTNGVLDRTTTNPLFVSGTSYLMATLRLGKQDTPESILERVQAYQATTTSNRKEWKCPIVLDLRAWGPDGSPHYRPPKAGTLKEVVNVLDRHGLAVVGIHGTPKELEQEATHGLGLPDLWAAGRPSAQKFALDDILQMVARRQQQEPIAEQEEESILQQMERITQSQTDSTPQASMLIQEERTVEDLEEDQSDVSTTEEPLPTQVPVGSTIYQGIVRSGQQISAEKGCSLVVLGSVSSGGEVMSDSDIIIMGKLRGRALAGLSSPSAKIIANCMDPELVAVGGVLSTGDQVKSVVSSSPTMVSLNENQELVFEKVSIR